MGSSPTRPTNFEIGFKMAIPTIDSLDAELLGLVMQVPAFANNGYSVFDVMDFDDKRGREALPAVGVAYEGCENPKADGSNPADTAPLVSMVVMQFAVIVAIQYRTTGEPDDTRVQAHQLLDDTRKRIQGYKGVNARPWRFIGEQPLPEPSGDGVVYYAQVWQTTLPSIGNFNQT